jgi:FUN14 domain-containing protein 1
VAKKTRKYLKMTSNNENVADVVKRTLDDIKDMSTMQQILVGGTAGLVTGYVLSRVGKLAAFTLGSGVIALQVAQQLGYIEVKWGKRSRIEELKRKALDAAGEVGLTKNDSKVDKVTRDVKKFFQKNITFGVSFGGGVLIGFSF